MNNTKFNLCYNMVKVNNIWKDNMNINESEVDKIARTNQPLFLKANFKSANINTGLLFSLSKSGRTVLAYIINTKDITKEFYLYGVEIINYIAENSDNGATTTTVNRGIKDLLDNGVIVWDNGYYINRELVWL